MNSSILYQWCERIDKAFPELGRWQKLGLALLSYGVVLAESCRLSRVARGLSEGEKLETIERRLQRWIANPRVQMKKLFPCWIGWVVREWGSATMLLLVDETKLSDHVSVMMVSLYYRQSAIPLLWRAYSPDDYPSEGQVEVLRDVLGRLRLWLPETAQAVLLADRGLGTSPSWQQVLTEQGWDYLLRVQGSTRIRLADGSTQPLRHLVGYGQRWTGRAQVFKKAGWHWRSVFVIWEVGYAQPWCLVSNSVALYPDLYAWRFSHEASFRDLKSDGFGWQSSHIWHPDHVERLLLGLALASFWTLATGTIVTYLYPLTKRQQRLSIFRLGLDRLFVCLHTLKQRCLELYFVPDTPLLKTVVP